MISCIFRTLNSLSQESKWLVYFFYKRFQIENFKKMSRQNFTKQITELFQIISREDLFRSDTVSVCEEWGVHRSGVPV